jgi:hypothetical protein
MGKKIFASGLELLNCKLSNFSGEAKNNVDQVILATSFFAVLL